MNRNINYAIILLFLLSCRTAPEVRKVVPPSLMLENAGSPFFYTGRADLKWVQYYPAKGFELQAQTPMGTETFCFDSGKRRYLFKFNLSGPYQFKIRALTGDGDVSDWSNEVNLKVKPVLTAVTAGNGTKTLVLELHPDKKDNIITSVPGRQLADIGDGDGRFYLLSSLVSENGYENQLLYTVIDSDSGTILQKTLSWPFGRSEKPPESAGICRIDDETIAFTARTEYATGLFIIDTEGNLLARELLPDFLLGPETNYREGKTALEHTQALTTEYQPVDKLLIIRGKANRENETDKNWQVRFDLETMTITESTLTEEFPQNQPLYTGSLAGRNIELRQNPGGNLTISQENGDGDIRNYSIFRDRNGFLFPVSFQTEKILRSDPKTLYLSVNLSENGKTRPLCIYIQPDENRKLTFRKVSVPDRSAGYSTVDLRLLESSPFPDEKAFNLAIQGKWKGIDDSGNPVFFQTGKFGIARIDYSMPRIGDGGFTRWEILWKNDGFSQIVLGGPGDGDVEMKVYWEIIGQANDEMIIFDILNGKNIYLYRVK